MKTILIVDDIYENLYLLRVILEGSGYSVIEAKDGREGLEKLQQNSIDLIISDILMPVMDGYMFCQACKKQKKFKDIPFIFYTSTYTEKLDEDFALKLGAVHFLRKPTDQEKIELVVDEIFKEVRPKVKPIKNVKFTEQEVLKLYSKRLISKLEQKNLDLENEVAERIKAQKALVSENEILDLIAKNTSLKKIFNHIILNYESINPEYMGSISVLHKDGVHLELISAPSMPNDYNQAVETVAIGKNVGSCGTAAFLKKEVIVSDISKDKLWADYKDLALKYNLNSCWSIPILSDSIVLGTFAIYSAKIKAPTDKEIQKLNSAVQLAKIAILKYDMMAEVKKREESYKSLVDQASDAIVTYSLDGTIHDFNKAAASSLGYTKGEFSKLKIEDIIVGNIILNPRNKEYLLDGKAIIFERQLLRKDGTILDGEFSAKLQNDGKILGIVRDITEWKLAQKKLLENEKSLLEAQRIAKIGSYNYDISTQVVQGSTTYLEIIGVDSETEVTYNLWRTITHPDDTPNNQAVFENCLKTGDLFDLEYRIITKTKKELKWIHGIGEIIYSNGKPINFIGTIQDITDRKQAEIALKASKKFTDKLIMSMQEGLLIVNLEGQIIMVNDSLCEILGYTKEELLGLNLPYPFAKTEDLELMLAIKEDVAKGVTKSFQLEFFRKNGENFIASFLSGNILDDKGEVIALFGTIKDMTEEDKVKRALEESAKKSNQNKEVILELASYVGENFGDALGKITTLSAKTLNVERVSVWKLNKDKTENYCEKLYNLKLDSFSSGLILKKKDHPNYFKQIEEKSIVSVNDAVKNKLTQTMAKGYLIPNQITAKMSIAINGLNGLYGIICFEHVGKNREWTADEQEFATSIASIVSLMVESTERKAAEDELVIINEELNNRLLEINELKSQLEQENVYLRNELDLVFNYEEMVYGSEEFSNVLTEVEKVAPTTATVLLLGESGTGKELLARAIHNTSTRNNKPLIKVNCSAIPRELIESELFGHKKGSFTGAFNDKVGKFELADGGTLFLDEIGELPLDMQPKILRFLQEGEIEVVGGTGLKKLDVRVIAATNRNLKEEIAKKQFREDLYFRLNVFPIEIPPLRKRKDDIPFLVEHFVDKFNKAYGKNIKYITDEAMTKLQAYEWPGNIRELENLIERASILSNNETLIIPGFESKTQKTKSFNNKDVSLDTMQRNHILSILEKCNWKISGKNGASELLDLKPSTLRDKMSKLGIKKPTSN